MRNFLALPIALGLAGFGSGVAFAGTINPSTALQDFNAIVYTNASTPSDIEGAVVVGGNFSGATVYNNPTAGQTQPAGYGALTVFGSTSGNPINIDNGGSAYVGGTSGAIVNFNGGGGFYTNPPSASISDYETAFDNLSTSLSQLTATSTLPTPGNNEAITATPGANGIAVFDITAAQLSQIPSYTMNMNGAATVIINVSGTSATFNANDESGTLGANNIIWNFYQATSVSLDTQIAGTVLATGANVTNQNQIDGDLIANSWTGSGELHDWAFDGPLPSTSGGGSVASAPEPASLALLGAGLVALGYARRRGLSIPR